MHEIVFMYNVQCSLKYLTFSDSQAVLLLSKHFKDIIDKFEIYNFQAKKKLGWVPALIQSKDLTIWGLSHKVYCNSFLQLEHHCGLRQNNNS